MKASVAAAIAGGVRYARLYAYFLRFSISRTLEFRVDFFFRILMDLVYYGVNIAFYQVLFLHTDHLGGWNRDQTLVFMAGYLVVDAINMTIFSNNLWMLPTYVNRGDMDYYLLRPVSSLFFLSLRDFAANSFLNLVFALGILAWALGRSPEPWTAGSVAIFLMLLCLGAFLHYMVHLLLLLPVFWIHSAGSMHAIFYNFQRFMERPHRIFTGWVRKALVTVLPFSLMASFPATVLLEGPDARMLAHFAAVTLAFFALTLFVWNRCLRAYSSASS
jgi:ABC-2 type transport system permease protein